MDILLLLLFFALVALPVKLGAHVVGADRTGLGWCMFAVFLTMVLQGLAHALLGKLALSASLFTAMPVYRYVLGTTWPRALGLSAIVLAVYVVLAATVLGSMLGTGVFKWLI